MIGADHGNGLQAGFNLLDTLPVAWHRDQALRAHLIQIGCATVPSRASSRETAAGSGWKAAPHFEEAYVRFLTDYVPQLKPLTQTRYRTTMRIVLAAFGNIYLDEITRGRLSDYATRRLREGVIGATVRRDLATLSVLCSCAVAWDYIDQNPVQQFSKRHIKESRPRTAFPTPEQVERLIATASPMAGRLIRFLSQTGMRLSEATTLEWTQVSLQRREVRLSRTKTSSPRVVPLSDAALDTLVGTPRHITSAVVFWHHDGVQFTNFSGYFRGIAARAKFSFRCHDLRHYFASTFAQQVGDLPALQAILGYKGITMTMRYSHLLTEHLHVAMNKYRTPVGTITGTTATASGQQTAAEPSTAAPDAASVPSA